MFYSLGKWRLKPSACSYSIGYYANELLLLGEWPEGWPCSLIRFGCEWTTCGNLAAFPRAIRNAFDILWSMTNFWAVSCLQETEQSCPSLFCSTVWTSSEDCRLVTIHEYIYIYTCTGINTTFTRAAFLGSNRSFGRTLRGEWLAHNAQ